MQYEALLAGLASRAAQGEKIEDKIPGPDEETLNKVHELASKAQRTREEKDLLDYFGLLQKIETVLLKSQRKKVVIGREKLFQFFAGTFNQDFFEEFPTWQAAIEDYKKDASKKELAELARQIRELAAIPDDAELKKTLDDLGCYYNPEENVGDWLHELATKLKN